LTSPDKESCYTTASRCLMCTNPLHFEHSLISIQTFQQLEHSLLRVFLFASRTLIVSSPDHIYSPTRFDNKARAVPLSSSFASFPATLPAFLLKSCVALPISPFSNPHLLKFTLSIFKKISEVFHESSPGCLRYSRVTSRSFNQQQQHHHVTGI
jgi:hypothetical protein